MQDLTIAFVEITKMNRYFDRFFPFYFFFFPLELLDNYFKKQLLGIPRCFIVSTKYLEETLFSRDVILQHAFPPGAQPAPAI